MTQRPFLEKASWVAGIFSAIIAAVVWLKPSASVEASMDQKPSRSAPVPPPKEGADQSAMTPSMSTLTKSEADTRWSCAGVASDLRPAFTSAKNITYTAPKDQAFLSLARKALCLKDYAMFEEAVKQISFTAPKDQAYGDAVDFALAVRDFALAEKFAGQITYTAPQDAARARIVAKASEMPANPEVQSGATR